MRRPTLLSSYPREGHSVSPGGVLVNVESPSYLLKLIKSRLKSEEDAVDAS